MAHCDTTSASADSSLAADVTDTTVVPGASNRETVEDDHVESDKGVVESLPISGASGQRSDKSTKSALCIIPPESVWDQIQAIRW